MEAIGSPGVVDPYNKTSTVCQVFHFVSIFLGPLRPYFPFTEEETGWSKTGKRGLSSLDNRHCDSWESKRVSRTILEKDSWKQ